MSFRSIQADFDDSIAFARLRCGAVELCRRRFDDACSGRWDVCSPYVGEPRGARWSRRVGRDALSPIQFASPNRSGKAAANERSLAQLHAEVHSSQVRIDLSHPHSLSPTVPIGESSPSLLPPCAGVCLLSRWH